MKLHALVAGLLALLAGCGTEDAPSGSAPRTLLRDANNYRTQSELTIPTVETAATDIDVCWADVTEDLQCHQVVPELNIDTVSLLQFRGSTEAAVAERLEDGELALSDLSAYLEFRSDDGVTCTKLSSFGFFTTPIDLEQEFVASEDYTYLLVFAEGTTPGVGARTTTFVKPTTNSTNTIVNAPNGCGILDFTANLANVEPVQLPGERPWTLDWSAITLDGQGNPAALDAVDRALLGFYPGMTLQTIEERIFDVELLANPLWELAVAPGTTSVDLADMRQREDGGWFDGFERDETGVWLFGLVCSDCQNPQPVVLSVLNPAAATR